MQGCLLDKIIDMQGKCDELVQREGRHTTRRFAPFGFCSPGRNRIFAVIRRRRATPQGLHLFDKR